MEEAEARVDGRPGEPGTATSSISVSAKVISPIDGQVSRYYLTLGNLVTQDQTLLTTVVSLDPMYAYFDVDEADRAAGPQGDQRRRSSSPQRAARFPSRWACRARRASPTRARSTSSTTRSIPPPAPSPCAASSPIPSPNTASALLSPGMFVRIRLPIGQPHPALLVIDRAVGTDQGLKVRLRRRRQEQSRNIAASRLGAAAGGRPAGDHRRPQAGRMGRRQRLAAGSPRMEVKPEHADADSRRRGERGQRRPTAGLTPAEEPAKRQTQSMRDVAASGRGIALETRRWNLRRHPCITSASAFRIAASPA